MDKSTYEDVKETRDILKELPPVITSELAKNFSVLDMVYRMGYDYGWKKAMMGLQKAQIKRCY